MEKDQFDGLIALKLVADKKSFTAAALELKVSPAAISKMINHLEKKMKISLLTRTTRTVNLTTAGKRFLDQVGPAMEQIINAQNDAKNSAAKPYGVLRLNMPSILYTSYLAPYISDFCKAYPDIVIDIVAEEQASNIFENGFDAGIRLSDILAKDLVAIKFFGPIRFVTAASPKYFEKFGKPKHPKELLNHNCIRLRFGSTERIYDKWEFEEKSKEFEVSVKGNLILNDPNHVEKAALNGEGIVFTDYESIRHLVEKKKLEIVLHSFHVESDGYYLYFPKRSQVQPNLRAFIDFFKKAVKK